MAVIDLHFAHANGFPAGSYHQIFSRIEEPFNCFSKAIFGHENSLDDDDNWNLLATELIDYCESKKVEGRPLWAVGHSMGAVVSFKACCHRPDLFAGLIMLDPPLIVGPMAPIFKIFKKTKYVDKLSPSGQSRMRKNRWAIDEDVVAYFKQKALFKNIEESCIQDYVNAGVTIHNGEKRLKFKRHVETQIFRQLPHDLNSYTGQLQCPAHVVVGRTSNVCHKAMYKPFAKKHKAKLHILPGGHMFPLEYPKQTAELLKRIVSKSMVS
ncbi:alpha/beta hydrolase [Alteromonas sp. 5E99-2]|uniref:alpha/beta fold hydrolase n=1 Tax=Alteromonas sp. 5E99-2 TaxID=2817683 RepID=UPI001A999BCA|nr:alpha/beta hydrolase [Alteromonas sp. 5E99-2]MBO1254932.1 alpha/beta hydrolase [Alteromonas sp. 5E99-2]